MRKEKLLEKKQEIMESAVWYLSSIMTEDEIKMFSRQQLEKLVEITHRAEKNRESCSPFFSLSATEVTFLGRNILLRLNLTMLKVLGI